MRPAKVPQHLELDDVVAWGLGAGDMLCVALGCTGAWSVVSSLDAALLLRVLLAAGVLPTGFALGIVRVGSRSLRSWAAAAAAFLMRRRILVTGGSRCG